MSYEAASSIVVTLSVAGASLAALWGVCRLGGKVETVDACLGTLKQNKPNDVYRRAWVGFTVDEKGAPFDWSHNRCFVVIGDGLARNAKIKSGFTAIARTLAGDTALNPGDIVIAGEEHRRKIIARVIDVDSPSGEVILGNDHCTSPIRIPRAHVQGLVTHTCK